MYKYQKNIVYKINNLINKHILYIVMVNCIKYFLNKYFVDINI